MYFHFPPAHENNLIYKTVTQPSLTAAGEIVSIFNLLIRLLFPISYIFLFFFVMLRTLQCVFPSSVHHHFNYTRFKPLYLNIIMSSAYVCYGFGDHIYALETS